MRHRLGLRKLNRTSAHRLAMLRNMSVSLLREEAIKTTLPKAKELRRVVEPIITLGKKPSVANRRLAFSRLRDRDMVVKVFDELGPRYASREGGYLRILKCGFRDGDNAPMAYVELPGETIVEARLTNVGLDEIEIGMPVELTQIPLDPDAPDSVLIHAFQPKGAA